MILPLTLWTISRAAGFGSTNLPVANILLPLPPLERSSDLFLKQYWKNQDRTGRQPGQGCSLVRNAAQLTRQSDVSDGFQEWLQQALLKLFKLCFECATSWRQQP